MPLTDVSGKEHVDAYAGEVDPDIEEVRLALAMNGGVSLAVWMGGCSVELDRARRTKPDGGESTVYQALCDAFRRELVIDVMSGSSAGGINGALLAGAMVFGRELGADFLRERWLELGDISRLLKPLNARSPTELMQGEYFEEQLRNTFTDLKTKEPPTSATLTQAPALDITTTDIRGRELGFQDSWRTTLYAREYRARFRFREEDDYDPAKLAAAARASASFPFAFDPYAPDDARDLAELEENTFVVDGGLLDNAPIRAALDLIPLRTATRQVRRILCYVNGHPAVGDEALPPVANGGKKPDPRSVIGIVLSLPRNAPFADQLGALQDATRNSGIADHAERELLAVPIEHLEAVAERLLPTYQRRRRLKALNDALEDRPAEVQRAYEALEDGAELPWLEGTLDPTPAAWAWGIDAARRVHELVLDGLRVVLPTVDRYTRRRILEERLTIDARLTALRGLRTESAELTRTAFESLARGEAPAQALAELRAQVESERGPLATEIEKSARALLRVLRLGSSEEARAAGVGYFGVDVSATPELTPEMHETFLRRAVAVEIVRRSFTDDDALHNPQQIGFGQLTPDAPTPILSETPFEDPTVRTAEDKLCGVILGHFGAFYRRSWRANDFLWGRMDAAARIVEMLVGSTRARQLAANDDRQPWAVLASRLVAMGDQQCTLLKQALDSVEPGSAEEPLEDRLREFIRKDLLDAPKESMGRKTRIICTLAAQFEVLRDELRYVADEAAKDFDLGCTPATLGLDGLDLKADEDVLEAVVRLRRDKCVLPAALGRDSRDEQLSDMAARTISHAGLIGLGLSRTAGRRLAMPLTPLRSSLLPVSGAVSLRFLNRLAVVLAFGAAALYLGGRLASTAATDVVDAKELSFTELLMTLVALLVVTGTIALPALRAALGKRGPRIGWGVTAALLLCVSGIGAMLLATLAGPLGWEHLLVAPGTKPPWWVTLLPIALGTGAAVVGPKPLRKHVGRATEAPWSGTWSLLLVLVAVGLVAWWSVPKAVDALSGAEWWQTAAAVAALAAPFVALCAVELLPRLLAKLSRNSVRRAARRRTAVTADA